MYMEEGHILEGAHLTVLFGTSEPRAPGPQVSKSEPEDIACEMTRGQEILPHDKRIPYLYLGEILTL